MSVNTALCAYVSACQSTVLAAHGTRCRGPELVANLWQLSPVAELHMAGSQPGDKPPAEEQEETNGMTYISFYGPLSGKISRLLIKYGIKTIHKPPTKIQNLLRPVKDDLDLSTPGVYKIPYKSSVVQRSLETGQNIDFGATTIVDKTSGCWDLVIMEAIEFQLDGNNFNINSTGFVIF
ncbi:hypothetical protein ANN_04444 [Periplaneta americana]|uniref:Uncharacterized protein n=1 Tax=Periplaneta americana TaxID=6978 RepID=A0ABQ8T9S6_PERAM|nr:hypothetical protein ANN_04444 [Periplaneta americana]